MTPPSCESLCDRESVWVMFTTDVFLFLLHIFAQASQRATWDYSIWGYLCKMPPTQKVGTRMLTEFR